MNTAYHGVLGLDALPKTMKRLNWIVCFIVTVLVTIGSYVLHVSSIPPELFEYGTFIAWVSPALIAAAWLRITGISWRSILVFLVFAPVTAFVVETTMMSFVYVLLGD